MSDASTIVDQAIAWHLRQDSMSGADWHGFTAWLEQPAHAQAYDTISRVHRLLGDVRFPAPVVLPLAANDDAPVAPGRRWWMLGGVGAAGLAAALALVVAPLGGAGEQRFVTRDGEQRTVTLADGSQIAMNGGTALSVARGGRSARLERGEAMLRVTHDRANPFVLSAGDQLIRDVGTRFDVALTERTLHVAVAEGAVALGDAAPMRLDAGDALSVDRATGNAVRSRVAPDSVGTWRSGTISFDAAPLGDVAAAVRRHEGAELVLLGDLPRRPFTGIVRLTGSADRDIPHLADLIGATWTRDGKRWVLAAEKTAAR